jgi:hypothetical protein
MSSRGVRFFSCHPEERMTAGVALVRALGGGWRAADLPSGSAVLSGSGNP